jgi:uncharacterized protein YjbJ (UPF0337 family)
MNWDQVEGNWKQWKGKAKEKWGKFTDDDWAMVQGKRDQLIGRIEERYGIAREEAERQVQEFLGSLDQPPRKEAEKTPAAETPAEPEKKRGAA